MFVFVLRFLFLVLFFLVSFVAVGLSCVLFSVVAHHVREVTFVDIVRLVRVGRTVTITGTSELAESANYDSFLCMSPLGLCFRVWFAVGLFVLLFLFCSCFLRSV